MLKRLMTLIVILFCFFALTNNSFAAIGATNVWEVRAAGSATNSGGFNPGNATPGTDFSQQDAAQDTGTDLACADGDAAAPVVTSVSHNFVDADEGNLIYISEAGTGFTLGYYEIVSTSTNAATLDRACGADGVLTGGDWSLGGATNHPDTISASVVAGNKIWIKEGTYQKVGANTYVLTASVAGGNGTPIVWEGYTATRGDKPTSADMPILDGNAGSATNCLVVSATANLFDSILVQNASGDNITISQFTSFFNIHSLGAGDAAIDGSVNFQLYGSELKTSASTQIKTFTTSAFYLFNNYIHDGSAGGLLGGGSSYDVTAINNVFDTNAGDGLNLKANGRVIGNVFFNNTGVGSDGFLNSGNGSTVVFMLNNVAQDNGQYGFNRSSATVGPAYFNYNIYEGNGSTGLNNIVAGANDSTVDPSFTDAANGNFTYSSSSSSAVGAGFPQSISGATGDYSWNIGVDQADHTVAGGSGGGASFFTMGN